MKPKGSSWAAFLPRGVCAGHLKGDRERSQAKIRGKGSLFTEFYEIVRKIPPGKVATYGQIAALSGNPRCARMVGWAMHGAPKGEGIPCHRVVNRKGELSPDYVFGGYEVQRTLLEAEGVSFGSDGRIDMAKSMWRPDFS